MDTQQKVTNHRPDRLSQSATAQSGVWEARQAIPECTSAEQAIPEYSANMHWIKEAAEAQIIGQSELH